MRLQVSEVVKLRERPLSRPTGREAGVRMLKAHCFHPATRSLKGKVFGAILWSFGLTAECAASTVARRPPDHRQHQLQTFVVETDLRHPGPPATSLGDLARII